MENVSDSTSGTNRYAGSGASGAPPAEQASQPIDQVKQQAQEAVRQIPQKAGELADRAREQVKSQVATQKERAAGGLEGVAQALRQTGHNLEEQDQAAMARYADSMAEQVERFSGYLRDQNVDQLMREVQSFARRQPALFLGTAFAAGFMAARFFKSSSPADGWDRSGSDRTGYGSMSMRTTDVAYEPASGLRTDLFPTDTSTAVTTTPTSTTVGTPTIVPAPGGD